MPTTPSDILTRLRAANPAPVSPERSREPTAQANLERILNDGGPDPGSRSARLTHPRLRRWLRVAPVLAATLIALGVMGAAMVLLGRGHAPVPTSRPPGGGISGLIAHTSKRQLRRELAYIGAATRRVQNSKACRSRQLSGPTYIQGSPGPDLLSILGVLRRAPVSADRLSPQAVGPVPDVYRNGIRRAFSADGSSYYIVPARGDGAASLSNRCVELQTAALNRYLPKIPAALRGPTREIQAAVFAYFHNMASHARDTICFVSVTGNSTGASCGTPPQQIKAGEVGNDNQGTYSGVVPDGVATVTLIFPAAAGHPERSVTAPVTGNVFAVRLSPRPRVPYPNPETVIWRSARGRVLKHISVPTNPAAVRAQVCKQEPIPCLLIEAGGTTSSSRSSASPVRSAPAHRPGG